MNSFNGDSFGDNEVKTMAVNESVHHGSNVPGLSSPIQNGLKSPSSNHKPMTEVSNHDQIKVSSKHSSHSKDHHGHKNHGQPKENSSAHKLPSKHSTSSSGEHKSKEHKHHSSSKDKSHSSGTKEGNSSSSKHSHSSSHSKHSSGDKKVDPNKPSGESKHKKEGGEKSDKSKHSSKDGEKPRHKEGGEKSHHKEHKDKVKAEVDSKNGLKMVIKQKPIEGSGEHKSSKHSGDKHKSHSDKSKSHSSSSGKIKHKSESNDNNHATVKMEIQSPVSEPSSPVKLSSPVKIKHEVRQELSDDDVPLTERKKAVKHELDESDEEPLASRMEKKKKSMSATKKRKSISDDDDDEDYNMSKPAKKVKKEIENQKLKNKKKPASTPASGQGASPTKKKKKQEEEQDVWKWWEDEKLDEGVKWRTLEHNGPVFALPYEPLPKSIKFYYDGKHMHLSPETEEVAGFYARMLEHDYVTKDAFNKNFFKDWKKVMTADERASITDLKKCNFKNLLEYFKVKAEERKAMTKEQKLAIKLENEELLKKFGFCIIDGHKQKVGNFKIEPPGLFRGRGEHPKMGMLKRRTKPEDVIINIGKEAPKPKAPEGHRWKQVRHDNTVTWLACWTENILGQNKYIMLNPSSKLKGEKDFKKYEMARKLKDHAESIRKEYREDWKSKEMKIRQRAVALYFIDKLALRAGNEKDEGETADTVGCCSLRVEHITLDDKKDGKESVVSFDFLGKDSIRYYNCVPVEKRVYKNLKLFMENKQPSDELFDRLNTAILNKYLNDLMNGLTAKVFRTYNASKTLQEQLDLLTKQDMSVHEKMLAYNRANRAVAILCNHQRAVPKTFDKQMENLQKKIEEKEDLINDVKNDLKKLKKDNSSNGRALAEKKKKRLNQLQDQLSKLEVQQTDKEENKQIALGTSKLNYLDPRISVAWCKKWDVPIEKIYNRTQRDKFLWAIEMAGPEYKF